MIINGFSFSGNIFSNTPVNISAQSIYMANGIYNDIHIRSNYYSYSNTIVKEWQDDTSLLALFENNLAGGNTDVEISDIAFIRIKRKYKDSPDSDYITIYEKEINTVSDTLIHIYDRYAKSKTDYTYAAVSVDYNGIEGIPISVDVTSDFCGIAIADKNKLYYTYFETEYDLNKTHNNIKVTTLNTKTPFIISNDITDYYNGSLSAMWIEENNGRDLDFDNAIKYRWELNNWLNNGEAKILKFDDSREWLINITGDIQERYDECVQKVITSFEWTECGDCDSADDLYLTGMINKNPQDYCV